MVVVAWLLAVVVLAWGVGERRAQGALDQRALRFVVRQRRDVVVSLARTVSHLGDPLVLVVLAVIATAWLATRRPLVEALAPAAALVGASITESLLKVVVGRDRPPVALHLLHETDASFPSGHTTGSAALFLAFALVVSSSWRSRRARVALVAAAGALAAVVGLCRMVLGVHWLTDVIAGWSLGAAFAIIAVQAAQEIAAWTAPPDP
ncbi:phosphatase PAP2 family protein [Aquihabitans sp. McL0605]|uniref:phosphatase PAP2 family protein n=1 Tax=Aquihabitans sp. McL0605 TaxID=3415671 RepID=UPI003CF7853C